MQTIPPKPAPQHAPHGARLRHRIARRSLTICTLLCGSLWLQGCQTPQHSEPLITLPPSTTPPPAASTPPAAAAKPSNPGAESDTATATKAVTGSAGQQSRDSGAESSANGSQAHQQNPRQQAARELTQQSQTLAGVAAGLSDIMPTDTAINGEPGRETNAYSENSAYRKQVRIAKQVPLAKPPTTTKQWPKTNQALATGRLRTRNRLTAPPC